LKQKEDQNIQIGLGTFTPFPCPMFCQSFLRF